MPSTTTERLSPRLGGPGISSFGRLRDARVIEHARAHAADALAGRMVWCMAGLPAGRSAARALHASLERPEDPFVIRRIELPAGPTRRRREVVFGPP